jgi:drug/metabolite transporter (DMT)-like permease
MLALAVLAWSGNWVVGRAMRHEIGPVAMAFWRWSFALLLLLPICFSDLRREWNIVRAHWKLLMLFGAIGALAFNVMIYAGLQFTETANATLFNSTVPVFIVALSWLAFGERPGMRQATGIVISLFGVLVIVSRGAIGSLLQLQINIGDIWIIAAMLAWSVYTILLRWRPAGLSPIVFLAAMLIWSLPLLVPFYVWELMQRGSFALTHSTVAALAYYATIPSVLAYIMWNQGVARVGASRAGLIVHLMPIFTIALSMLFLGEAVFAFHFVGAACVFAGIWLTTSSAQGLDGRNARPAADT